MELRDKLFIEIHNQRIKLGEIESQLSLFAGQIDSKEDATVIYQAQADIERISRTLLELQRVLA
jgi:hypothetical protein